jgi:hypothetical protein
LFDVLEIKDRRDERGGKDGGGIGYRWRDFSCASCLEDPVNALFADDQHTILLLTGAILTLKIITDGDHSLSSNLGVLSGVRSVCSLCAVCVRSVCGLCAVVCGARAASLLTELANDVGAPC